MITLLGKLHIIHRLSLLTTIILFKLSYLLYLQQLLTYLLLLQLHALLHLFIAEIYGIPSWTMSEVDYIPVLKALRPQGLELDFCLGTHDPGAIGWIEISEYKFPVGGEEDSHMKLANRLMLQLNITFLMVAQNKRILLIQYIIIHFFILLFYNYIGIWP